MTKIETSAATEEQGVELQQVFDAVDRSRYVSAAVLTMPDTQAMAFASTSPSGHTITVDAGPGSGGASSGPEPLGLVLVALGTCTGMDVISILRKKRQAVTSYTINVYGNRATEHPKTYTEILVEHVVGGQGVDPKAVARAVELSITKYCSVHALLSKAIPVEHVYRVLETAPGENAPGE